MKILGIDNVFFQVGELEKAVPFYEKLGFILKFKIPRINAALFKMGDEEPGLMLCEIETPQPSRLWVETVSALEAQKGWKDGLLLETATGFTFEVLDPWGNTIGFADYSNKRELARKDKDLLIRPMNENDIPQIVSRYSFPWNTPEKTKMLWDTYFHEQQNGVRTVAVLEKNGEILGYGSLLRKPECPFFVNKNIPEINAIWIDENQRRQGLGKALIKWLEDQARQEGYKQIGIGVGLYKDYGPAQKLYFQLGYIPEGNGITYKGEPTLPLPGQAYPLDDDLIFWFVKGLI
jgi:GNAT superfamily N-acetyltransferase